MTQPPILIKALCNPDWLAHATMVDWDLIIRQGRNANLLARLDVIVRQSGIEYCVPKAPAMHLLAARHLAEKHANSIKHEATCLQLALSEVNQPLILLKGAAYTIAKLPPAAGRIFSDVDLLVPKNRLDHIEQILIHHGWQTAHHDAYDQRYYRTWMHELPPMIHDFRDTVIDVHHSILPETARLHPDPKKLIAAAVPVSGWKNVFVLAPTDMVLHSATHLFHDGEFEHGLRDLIDLDSLLRHFSEEANFWKYLIERAAELELSKPLYYALHFTRKILGTPVPEATLNTAADRGKTAIISSLMDALLARALMPAHPSCEDHFTPHARWLLYIRSHYLRMPLHLLIPHLIRKSLIKRDLLRKRKSPQEKMREELLKKH